MCGRFFLDWLPETLKAVFGTHRLPVYEPSWNIAPGQYPPVLVHENGGDHWITANWGFVPEWAKSERTRYRMINARSESVTSKPAFRDAWRHRRCIIPMSGYYEWQTTPDGKQPYAIAIPGQPLLAAAGIWASRQTPDHQTLNTFAIITVTATAAIRAIHDRMPLLLADRDYQNWLSGSSRQAQQLLGARPPEGISPNAISREVNRVANDGPHLLNRAIA